MSIQAWAAVRESTIVNCWVHTKIINNLQKQPEEITLDSDLQQVFQEVTAHIESHQQMTLTDYMELEKVLTEEVPSVKEIVAEVREDAENENEQEGDGEGDENEGERQRKEITQKEAESSLETLLTYMRLRDDEEDYVVTLLKLQLNNNGLPYFKTNNHVLIQISITIKPLQSM